MRKKTKMIWFDYGQTLVNEAKFDGVEGIASFLESLHQNNIRTGVLSNISYAGTVVQDRINRLLPNHHFEFIIATSEYMYRKPHKRIFDLILSKSGLSADEVWYIGDQYECDIAGAKSAGIFPVWYLGAIDMPYEDKEDVLKIADWKELQTMLAQNVLEG